jgi:hypothetical protein
MKLEDLQDSLLEFIEDKGPLRKYTVREFYVWVRDQHTPLRVEKEGVRCLKLKCFHRGM